MRRCLSAAQTLKKKNKIQRITQYYQKKCKFVEEDNRTGEKKGEKQRRNLI